MDTTNNQQAMFSLGEFAVETHSGKLINLKIRERWLSEENNSLSLSSDAEGHAACRGKIACGHAPCRGKIACGNHGKSEFSNNIFSVKKVEQFYTSTLGLIPEKTASVKELISLRIKALSA